jgi:hypothetical protein
MTVITLPPEIEAPLAAEASRRGIDVQTLAIEELRRRFTLHASKSEDRPPQGGSLYDSIKHVVGSVHGTSEAPARRSSEIYAEALAEKHARREL